MTVSGNHTESGFMPENAVIVGRKSYRAGNVTAQFLGSNAGYFNTLYLDSPGEAGNVAIFDKYSPVDGHPIHPDGIAEPERDPLFPQRFAEIMGGRIALTEDESVMPDSLKYAVIGPLTAREINIID